MALEAIIVAVASFLLAISGIPAAPMGQFVYLSSLHRLFEIQVGLYDWINLLLLDFFYVFAIWAYVTFRGRTLQFKKYFELGAVGFSVMFLGIGVKVFAQIFFAVGSGTASFGSDATILGSLDLVGIGAMFMVTILAVCSTCLIFSIGFLKGQSLPFAPDGPKPTP